MFVLEKLTWWKTNSGGASWFDFF